RRRYRASARTPVFTRQALRFIKRTPVGRDPSHLPPGFATTTSTVKPREASPAATSNIDRSTPPMRRVAKSTAMSGAASLVEAREEFNMAGRVNLDASTIAALVVRTPLAGEGAPG